MPGQKRKVCKLIKLLYGLKQAPKQWREKFDTSIVTNGFRICVYSKFHAGKGIIIYAFTHMICLNGYIKYRRNKKVSIFL